MSIMATHLLILVSLLAFLVTSTAAVPLGGDRDGEIHRALQDQWQRFVRCVEVSDGTLDCKTLLPGKGSHMIRFCRYGDVQPSLVNQILPFHYSIIHGLLLLLIFH